MPFYNYRFSENNGMRAYCRGHEVKLTGTEGILARYLKSLPSKGEDRVSWALSGLQIAQLACPDCENTSKELFLDLYPEGFTEVALHRVERIVGVSEEDWTDAVIVTRPVLVGAVGGLAEETRKAFAVELPFPGREMMEAFGIQGGFAKGNYKWTKPKMNIGAAVCGCAPSSDSQASAAVPDVSQIAPSRHIGCGSHANCRCGG